MSEAAGTGARNPAGLGASGSTGGSAGGSSGQGMRLSPAEKRRLADVLSSSGVDSRRVAVELLYLLPESFVVAYTEMFHRAYALGDEGKGAAEAEKAALGKWDKGKGKPGRGGSGGGGGGGRSVFPTRDAGAALQKAWVDRSLRKLARAMLMGEGAGAELNRQRCGKFKEGKSLVNEGEIESEKEKEEGKGCGKWIEEGWEFCPRCGRRARRRKPQSLGK